MNNILLYCNKWFQQKQAPYLYSGGRWSTSNRNSIFSYNSDNRNKRRISLLGKDNRMVEVVKKLWELYVLRQEHLATVAHHYVQMVFGDLQGERLHNISGEPVPVLSHLQSTKHLLIFKWSMFQLVSIASCPVSEQHRQVPLPSSLHPYLRSVYASRSLNLLFSTLKRPSSLSLFS